MPVNNFLDDMKAKAERFMAVQEAEAPILSGPDAMRARGARFLQSRLDDITSRVDLGPTADRFAPKSPIDVPEPDIARPDVALTPGGGLQPHVSEQLPPTEPQGHLPRFVEMAYNQSLTGVAHELVFGKPAFDLSGYDPNVVEDIAAEVMSFIMPLDAAVMAAGGGVGGAVVKKLAPKVVTKLVASGVNRTVAEVAVQRVIGGGVRSGSALGAYGAARPALEGRYGDISDEALKSGALGFILGATGGAAAPLTRLGTNPMTGAIESPLKHVAGQAGALGAEVGAFAGGGAAVEGRMPTMDDLQHAASIVVGLRLQHKITGAALGAAKRKVAEYILNRVLEKEGTTVEDVMTELQNDPKAWGDVKETLPPEAQTVADWVRSEQYKPGEKVKLEPDKKPGEVTEAPPQEERAEGEAAVVPEKGTVVPEKGTVVPEKGAPDADATTAPSTIPDEAAILSQRNANAAKSWPHMKIGGFTVVDRFTRDDGRHGIIIGSPYERGMGRSKESGDLYQVVFTDEPHIQYPILHSLDGARKFAGVPSKVGSTTQPESIGGDEAPGAKAQQIMIAMEPDPAKRHQLIHQFAHDQMQTELTDTKREVARHEEKIKWYTKQAQHHREKIPEIQKRLDELTPNEKIEDPAERQANFEGRRDAITTDLKYHQYYAKRYVEQEVPKHQKLLADAEKRAADLQRKVNEFRAEHFDQEGNVVLTPGELASMRVFAGEDAKKPEGLSWRQWQKRDPQAYAAYRRQQEDSYFDRQYKAGQEDSARIAASSQKETRFAASGPYRSQARTFEGRLKKLRIAYRRYGWGDSSLGSKGQSVYFEIADHDGEYLGTIRFSDHAQPAHGGRSSTTGERHGKADISADPATGYTWKDAIQWVEDHLVTPGELASMRAQIEEFEANKPTGQVLGVEFGRVAGPDINKAPAIDLSSKKKQTFRVSTGAGADVGWKLVEGTLVDIGGDLTAFVHKGLDGGWSVTEATTGVRIMGGRTRSEAIENAKETVEANDSRIEETIAGILKKRGEVANDVVADIVNPNIDEGTKLGFGLGGATLRNPFSRAVELRDKIKQAISSRREERGKLPTAMFEPEPKDVGLRKYFLTPTFVLGAIPEMPAKFGRAAQSAMRSMVLAEMSIKIAQGRRQGYIDETLKMIDKADLGKAGEKFIDDIFEGKDISEIETRTDISEGTKQAARRLRKLFDRDRNEWIQTTRDRFRSMVTKQLTTEWREANGLKGERLDRDQRAELEGYVDSKLEAALDKYMPRDAGIDFYFPHLFPGDYRIFVQYSDGKREFVTSGKNKLDALAKIASDWVDRREVDPDATYRVDKRLFTDPDVVRVSRRRYFGMVKDLESATEVSPQEIQNAMRGKIGTKEGKQKHFFAFKKRQGYLGYSRDLERVLSTYSRGFVRWKILTKLNADVQGYLQQIGAEGRPNTKQYVETIFNQLWGWQSDASRAVDSFFQRLPWIRDRVTPMMLDRVTSKMKSAAFHTLLLWSPRFHVLNSMQTVQTLWPLVDSPEFLKARAMYHTAEGRNILRRWGVRYLTGGKLAEAGVSSKRAEFREKVGELAPETANQGVAFLTMYHVAKNRGYSDREAAQYALLRGNVFSQFAFLQTDRPLLMRGPIQSTIFLFKRFPIKNLELGWTLLQDKNYPGIAKWLGTQWLLGGTKSFSTFYQTPLSLFGKGYIPLALYNQIKDEAGEDVANLFMFGLPGLLGMDLSYSINMVDIPHGDNLPERIGNLALGPVGNITYGTMGAVTDTKGTVESPIERGGRSLIQRLPSMRWMLALEQVFSGADEGKYDFRKPNGVLKFKGDLRDVIINGLGGRPLEAGKLDLWLDAMADLQAQRSKILDEMAMRWINKGEYPEVWPARDKWNEMWPEAKIDRAAVRTRRKAREKNVDKPTTERAIPENIRQLEGGL